MPTDERYMTYMGKGGKKLIHWEHWSNPDAETFLTGIDYYNHPRQCREKLRDLYPMLGLPIPQTDAPLSRPKLGTEMSSNQDDHTVRWGDSETATFLHGEGYFKSADDVFKFSPLEHGDFSGWKHVVTAFDYSSDDVIFQQFRKQYPADWGDKAPEGSSASFFFYNTMFMWPLLTFGWELFLECCMEDEFERIMDEFAEINRRVFRAISKLPVNFVICHDDIVTTRGPVCSPS